MSEYLGPPSISYLNMLFKVYIQCLKFMLYKKFIFQLRITLTQMYYVTDNFSETQLY